jgi:hypothetical protein
MRQANAILQRNKDKRKTKRICPGFEFKPRQVNDSSQSNHETDHLVSQGSTKKPVLLISTCTVRMAMPAAWMSMGVLYLGLYLTALGTGGLKSSVSGFGSNQFDETDIGERKLMARFFSWFFFISIGSLLAVTVLLYVQDNLGRP